MPSHSSRDHWLRLDNDCLGGESFDTPKSRPTRTLERAAVILEVLGTTDFPLSLSEIARRSRLPKSTTYRLLTTLRAHDLVRDLEAGYELGGGFSQLRDPGLRRQLPAPRRQILPHMVRLHEQTRQTINLGVLVNGEVVYVERIYGHNRVPSPSDHLDRAPTHCTAAGKVLVAFGAAGERAGEERPVLPRRMQATITSLHAMGAELQRVREQGLAFNVGEFAPHLACVAAPVMGRPGGALAAIAVAAPVQGFDPQRIVSPLRRAAHEISLAIRSFRADALGGGGTSNAGNAPRNGRR